MKNKIIVLLFSIAIAMTSGCVSSQSDTGGVISLGGDTYMISQSSAAGVFANMNKLRNDVIAQANAYAAARGKRIDVISSENHPSAPGQFPYFELTFKLTD